MRVRGRHRFKLGPVPQQRARHRGHGPPRDACCAAIPAFSTLRTAASPRRHRTVTPPGQQTGAPPGGQQINSRPPRPRISGDRPERRVDDRPRTVSYVVGRHAQTPGATTNADPVAPVRNDRGHGLLDGCHAQHDVLDGSLPVTSGETIIPPTPHSGPGKVGNGPPPPRRPGGSAAAGSCSHAAPAHAPPRPGRRPRQPAIAA
jgi:hypothetical protein